MNARNFAMAAAALVLLTSCYSNHDTASSIINVFGNKAVEFNGPMVTRTANVKNVTAITTTCSIEVEYTQGPRTSVSYTLPEDAIDYFNLSANGGTLHLTMKNGYNYTWNNKRIKVTVTAPAVNDFSASSSGVINIAALNLPQSDVEFDASSSGKIVCGDIACFDLDIEASSSGKVTAADVKAQEVSAEVSSSGNAQLNTANCQKAEFSASSAGSVEVKVNATAMVEADASSAGSVSLTGTAPNVDFSASSGAAIYAGGLKAQAGRIVASSGARVTSNVLRASTSSNSGGIVDNTSK